MNRKFIVDEEVNLNTQDYLKTSHYSRQLKEAILNTPKNKVFTIGLFGPWGSGKSSIVETTKTELEAEDIKLTKSESIKVIKYDAWQYVNDSFRRNFLLKLQNELQIKKRHFSSIFYKNISKESSTKFQLSFTRIVITLAAIALCIKLSLKFNYTIYENISLLLFLSAITSFILLFQSIFNVNRTVTITPYLFSPEQFEGQFRELTTIALASNELPDSPITKVWQWIKNPFRKKYKKKYSKIVIVIDNIDRCTRETSYNLLTDIKTFLGNTNQNIVFVIPIDDEALKFHLFNTTKEGKDTDPQKEKEEFLRKFFNLVIRIKPYQNEDIYSFAESINHKNNLGFTNQTLSVASQEYSKNPRRIIQLFNNLTIELNSYTPEFIKDNETLICSIIIMREEFPALYKFVINSPISFIDRIKHPLPDELLSDQDISKFLRITKNYFSHLAAEDLLKILTNTGNLFANIPVPIIEAINTFDINKITSYYDENEENIRRYLIYNAIKQRNNNLFHDLTSSFELIMKLDRFKEFPISYLTRCNNLLLDSYPNIIKITSEYKTFCLFANKLESYKIPDLKQAIIIAAANNNAESNNWLDLFKTALSTFKDTNSIRKLSPAFALNYERINIGFKYSDEQIKILFNNQLISNISVTLNYKNKKSLAPILLAKLIKRKSDIAESLDSIFTEIERMIPPPDNSSIPIYLKIVDYLYPVFHSISNKQFVLDDYIVLQKIYSKLYSKVGFNEPDIFNEEVNPEKSTILISAKQQKFQSYGKCKRILSWLFSVTNCKLDITDSLYTILDDENFIIMLFTEHINNTNSHIVARKIIKLISSDLDPNFNIVSKLLDLNYDGIELIDSETAEACMRNIILYNSDNANLIDKFLKLLDDKENAKERITRTVLAVGDQNFIYLPDSMDSFILKQIGIKDYMKSLGYHAFLEKVIARGNRQNTSAAVNILNTHIQNDQHVSSSLALYGNVNDISVKDIESVIETLNEYLTSYGPKINENLRSYINHLLILFKNKLTTQNIISNDRS